MGRLIPLGVRRLLPTEGGEDSSTGKDDLPDLMGSVYPASSGCPNIVPCFGWLDITEMYTLTILKAAAAAAKSLQSCPTL